MRAGDSNNAHYFRSDRVFCVEGEWFFATREGKDQGPYTTRTEAERETAAYGRFYQRLGTMRFSRQSGSR